MRSARLAIPIAPESAPASDASDADPADSLPDTGITLDARAGRTASAHPRLEIRRSGLAAPDFDRADVLRRVGFGAPGTYILAMLDVDSGLARWPERPLEPIRVWVEPTSTHAD